MDKKTIRITGAQCSFSVGAIQENKETILNCFEEAESVESDIVIFPELALTGYPPEDLLLRESFIGKNFAVLEEIAAFSSHTSGVIGFVDRKNDSHNQDNNKRTIANAAATVCVIIHISSSWICLAIFAQNGKLTMTVIQLIAR